MSTVVTGHGRSGTMWLAGVLSHFVDTKHEPGQREVPTDIVVDCRLWPKREQLEREGRRIIHLIRDGRDVVRSTHAFYQGSYEFEKHCRQWAQVVDAMEGLPTVRLEDLLRPKNETTAPVLQRWPAWSPERTDTFWRICGEQMARHGYER